MQRWRVISTRLYVASPLPLISVLFLPIPFEPFCPLALNFIAYCWNNSYSVAVRTPFNTNYKLLRFLYLKCFWNLVCHVSWRVNQKLRMSLDNIGLTSHISSTLHIKLGVKILIQLSYFPHVQNCGCHSFLFLLHSYVCHRFSSTFHIRLVIYSWTYVHYLRIYVYLLFQLIFSYR